MVFPITDPIIGATLQAIAIICMLQMKSVYSLLYENVSAQR